MIEVGGGWVRPEEWWGSGQVENSFLPDPPIGPPPPQVFLKVSMTYLLGWPCP